MLYEAMMDDCVFVEKTRVNDGLGGFNVAWTDGAKFKAAIKLDNSIEAETAEKQGVTSIYLVSVFRSLPLEYHDVFRRLKDGAIFRVTSNITDNTSPEFSAIDLGQVRAERWELV